MSLNGGVLQHWSLQYLVVVQYLLRCLLPLHVMKYKARRQLAELSINTGTKGNQLVWICPKVKIAFQDLQISPINWSQCLVCSYWATVETWQTL